MQNTICNKRQLHKLNKVLSTALGHNNTIFFPKIQSNNIYIFCVHKTLRELPDISKDCCHRMNHVRIIIHNLNEESFSANKFPVKPTQDVRSHPSTRLDIMAI